MTYFPTPQGGSIIGVRGLDFRVRNGNGYNTSTIITRQLITLLIAKTQVNFSGFCKGHRVYG